MSASTVRNSVVHWPRRLAWIPTEGAPANNSLLPHKDGILRCGVSFSLHIMLGRAVGTGHYSSLNAEINNLPEYL